MNATVSYEETSKTSFGDPEILITVQEPHPWAGRQFLLKSTDSIDHMHKLKVKTGRTTYLVYGYPEDLHDWHGAISGTTLEGVIKDITDYVDWLYEREQVRDYLDTSTLREHLVRFDEGLYGHSPRDYKAEWLSVLEEVARISLVMEGMKERD